MHNEVIYNHLLINREDLFGLRILPGVARQYVDSAPELLKDSAFFTCMAALSVYNSRLKVSYNDNSDMGVQIQVFISAPQANGKGNLDKIQREIMELMSNFNDDELARENDYRTNHPKSHHKMPFQTCVFILPPSTSRFQMCRRASDIQKRFNESGGICFYTFSPEIGMAIDASQQSYSDLRNVNLITYDGGKIGMDHGGENSFHGQVNARQSLLYLGTPSAMNRYFNTLSIENGTLGLVIICSFKQPIGSRKPVFDDITTAEKAKIDKVLHILFNEVFDPADENQLMPTKHLDMKFLYPEINNFEDVTIAEAIKHQSYSIDTFRKRSAVNAFRIAAISYNMYLTENKILPPTEQLSQEEIEDNVKVIFCYSAYHILHSILEKFGETAETLNQTAEQNNIPASYNKTSLYDLMPKIFSHKDVKDKIEEQKYRSNVCRVIYKWKQLGKIEEIEKMIYQKTEKANQ